MGALSGILRRLQMLTALCSLHRCDRSQPGQTHSREY